MGGDLLIVILFFYQSLSGKLFRILYKYEYRLYRELMASVVRKVFHFEFRNQVQQSKTWNLLQGQNE